jgi:hypothetical protein
VRERASDWRIRLFRNNSGALPNPDTGIPVRFGLGNESKESNKELKSGDLVGWTPVVITQEMVGKTVPVFTNIEAKPAGFKHRDVYPKSMREYGQNNWNVLVVNAGGIAGFASTAEEVDKIVKDFVIRVTA